jgi:hypothetical protein
MTNKKSTSVDSVLEDFKGKKKAIEKSLLEEAELATSTSKLEMLWKHGWSVYREDYCSFAISDRNRMAGMRKSLKGKTGPVILWALENWAVFTELVQTAKGKSITPDKPQVSFLLLHRDVALDHYGNYSEAAQEPQGLPMSILDD